MDFIVKCVTLKGAVCKMYEYLFSENHYNIHNYVLSGVPYKMNRNEN